MPFSELVWMALDTLRASKLRSALTLLGMVIGVFAIIVSVTAVKVIESSITNTIQSFGSTSITVTSFPEVRTEGGGRRRDRANYVPLDYEQVVQLGQRLGPKAPLAPESSETARFRAGSAVTDPNVTLTGTNEEWATSNGYDLARGRMLSPEDVQFARPVVVIGASLADKLFGTRNPVGKDVVADRGRYQVIGVLKKKGATGFGGNDPDLIALTPLPRLFALYGNPGRDLQLKVRAPSATLVPGLVEDVIGALRVVRAVKPGETNNFSVQTSESSIGEMKSLTNGLTAGGAGIGLLTLLAAGIGIMNIMLVSVTERTREIGIRKSLGARRGDVLRQFLIEAVVLCQVGAVIGVVAGVGTANLLALVFDTPPTVPWAWVTTAFVGVTLFGVVFGVYPAWKAARLDPIEALRFE